MIAIRIPKLTSQYRHSSLTRDGFTSVACSKTSTARLTSTYGPGRWTNRGGRHVHGVPSGDRGTNQIRTLRTCPGRYARSVMPNGKWEERPYFRETHAIRLPAVAVGAAGGSIWYVLFGLLWGSAAGYSWLTILAGVVAVVVALTLCVRGDRGAAVGIALASAFSVSATGLVVIVHWLHGNWLLW